MNLLEGVIERSHGVSFAGPGGVNVGLDDYPTNAGLPLEKQVVLGFRPEHVHLLPSDGTQEGLYTGTVELEEPMGADNLVWVNWAGKSICCRTDAKSRFHPNQTVSFNLAVDQASLFDADTEIRL